MSYSINKDQIDELSMLAGLTPVIVKPRRKRFARAYSVSFSDTTPPEIRESVFEALSALIRSGRVRESVHYHVVTYPYDLSEDQFLIGFRTAERDSDAIQWFEKREIRTGMLEERNDTSIAK